MKLIASLLSLTLVAALSAWLWLGQGPTDIETAGVDLTAASPDAPDGEHTPRSVASESGSLPEAAQELPGMTDEAAAAFVGLQAAFDVWKNQPQAVLSDPALLTGALAEARGRAEVEVAAEQAEAAAEKAAADKAAADKAAAEKAAADQAAAEKAAAEERARQNEPPRVVSPPPVDDWDDDDDDDD